MERRHFELIAAVLNEAGSHMPIDMAGREYIARRFADTLAKCNSGFNRERFLKACGVAS